MNPTVDHWLDGIAVALIFLAAPPATMFPIVYATRPWHATLIGRALMTKAIGLALLIDISIVYQLLGDDYPFRNLVRVGVYTLVVVGIWIQFIAMARAGRTSPRSDARSDQTLNS